MKAGIGPIVKSLSGNAEFRVVNNVGQARINEHNVWGSIYIYGAPLPHPADLHALATAIELYHNAPDAE